MPASKPAPVQSVDKKAASAAAHVHPPSPAERDGLSEHPPAAMMLLVLGTSLVTIA